MTIQNPFTHRITLPSMNETRLLFDEATLSYFLKLGQARHAGDFEEFKDVDCYSGFAIYVSKQLKSYLAIKITDGDALHLSSIPIPDILGETVDMRTSIDLASAKLDLPQLRRDLPNIMEVKLQSHPGILSSWSDLLITKLDTEALYLALMSFLTPMPHTQQGPSPTH